MKTLCIIIPFLRQFVNYFFVQILFILTDFMIAAINKEPANPAVT